EGPQPRAKRREGDINGVLGVADHGKGRQHVPDRAPIRRPDPAPTAYRSVEEHIGRVGRGCGGKNACSDQRIDCKSHVYLSAMPSRAFILEMLTIPDHLIASGLVGDPTAPVIGIAGATNMNS